MTTALQATRTIESVNINRQDTDLAQQHTKKPTSVPIFILKKKQHHIGPSLRISGLVQVTPLVRAAADEPYRTFVFHVFR